MDQIFLFDITYVEHVQYKFIKLSSDEILKHKEQYHMLKSQKKDLEIKLESKKLELNEIEFLLNKKDEEISKEYMILYRNYNFFSNVYDTAINFFKFINYNKRLLLDELDF